MILDFLNLLGLQQSLIIVKSLKGLLLQVATIYVLQRNLNTLRGVVHRGQVVVKPEGRWLVLRLKLVL